MSEVHSGNHTFGLLLGHPELLAQARDSPTLRFVVQALVSRRSRMPPWIERVVVLRRIIIRVIGFFRVLLPNTKSEWPSESGGTSLGRRNPPTHASDNQTSPIKGRGGISHSGFRLPSLILGQNGVGQCGECGIHVLSWLGWRFPISGAMTYRKYVSLFTSHLAILIPIAFTSTNQFESGIVLWKN